MQVEVTVRITGEEPEVGAYVREIFGRRSDPGVLVAASAIQPTGHDLRTLVEAMRDELTERARQAVRAIAEQSRLEGNGRAYSKRVRLALGDISPAALAGRLGPVTAFAGRHNNFWPFTRRWTGTEMEYQMDQEVAALALELL